MIRIKAPGRLNLGILASGRGSNFEAIAAAIGRGDLQADIAVVISDKEQAPILNKAEKMGISARLIVPAYFSEVSAYEDEVVRTLQKAGVDMVVLAGYMRLIGTDFIKAFPYRIVNIHPALLPAFRGLYAQRQAVEAGVRFSGCTVHIVDQGMDTGPIILQAVVPVLQDDDEDGLTQRILAEEHRIYWQALQLYAEGRIYVDEKRVIIPEA